MYLFQRLALLKISRYLLHLLALVWIIIELHQRLDLFRMDFDRSLIHFIIRRATFVSVDLWLLLDVALNDFIFSWQLLLIFTALLTLLSGRWWEL